MVRKTYFNNDTREMASKLHKNIWRVIRDNKYLKDWSFLQEQTINTDSGNLYVDFLCKNPIKVAIEVQGQQHSKYIEHFHGTYSEFKKQQERDVTKKEWLEDNGFAVIYFNYNDNLTDNEIIKRIMEGL
jgi:very-short-patch-repair endonuclease